MQLEKLTGEQLRGRIDQLKATTRDYDALITACTPVYEEMKRRAQLVAKKYGKKSTLPPLTAILR